MLIKRQISLLIGLCVVFANAEPLMRNGGAANSARIAFVSTRSGNPDIYVMDSDGNLRSTVTTHDAEDTQPTWSPDGEKIAFASNREEKLMEVYVMDADGRNVKRITHNFHDQEDKFMPTWSPGGRRIAYVWNLQIYVMDSDGENQRRLTERGEGRYPTWSPDGGAIAYESWEGFGSPHGIYTAGVRSGAVTLISEVHRKGDFQPDSDWFNPWELPVSPAGNRITVWGRLKNAAVSLR